MVGEVEVELWWVGVVGVVVDGDGDGGGDDDDVGSGG